VNDIIDAQLNVFLAASSINSAFGTGEPIRPVLDGSLITTPLDSTAAFTASKKPLLISNVLNEAGLAIYGNVPVENATMPGFYANQVIATFGEERAAVILNSSFYPAVTQSDGVVDARQQLEPLGTDYLWKCAAWTFAREWSSKGGTAYVAMYTVGATYPVNSGIDFCTQPGSVCHQDDIEIVVCPQQGLPSLAQYLV
jgi:carboxylesterase type B